MIIKISKYNVIILPTLNEQYLNVVQTSIKTNLENSIR